MNRTHFSSEVSDAGKIETMLADLIREHAEAIIRFTEDHKFGIRCTITQISETDASPSFLLSGISAQGMTHLKNQTTIQLEIFGSLIRLSFSTQVLRIGDDSVRARLPELVMRMERRLSQRFRTHEQRQAYFDPGAWHVAAADLGSPPVFGLYQPLASWAVVTDISFGGICVETRFPSLLTWLEANPRCLEAELILPMLPPFKIGMELRWTKRLRERNPSLEAGYTIVKYRIGLAYTNPPRELMLIVGRFIRDLQMDQAI